jgi:quercetin dioxygenase-like cupin family protein
MVAMRAGILSVVLLVGVVAAGGAEVTPVMPELTSTVIPFASLKAQPTPVGIFRRVTDNPTVSLRGLECHVTTLNPGKMSHPPHQHPQEEFIILQTGTLDVYINGKVTRIGPGSMFFFASLDWHNVTNVGDAPALYHVFNVTTDATAHVPAKPAVEWEPATALHSSVWPWDSLQATATPTGQRRDIVNSPTVTCARFEAHVTTLRSGEATAASRHADDAILLIKDGDVEITAAGVKRRATTGDFAFIASNEEPMIRNAGSTAASYYAIQIATDRTPPAAAPTALR